MEKAISEDNTTETIKSGKKVTGENITEENITEEMGQFTWGLVLLDAVPVLVFLASCLIIYSMFGSPVFLAGAIASFAGGSAKVLWKLIVVLKKRDKRVLTKAFHILMPAGFGLMLLSIIVRTIIDAAGGDPLKTLSGLWNGLTMMPAGIFFLAGFAGMFLMGYLGSHMDGSARSNYIEEIVNTIAQLAMLIGVIIVFFGR